MDLSNWEEPKPGHAVTPVDDHEWLAAVERYLHGINDVPLRRCLEVAKSAGARTIVVETRYLDVDYRSEYSAYYSRAFPTVPSSTHRLHFFQEAVAK